MRVRECSAREMLSQAGRPTHSTATCSTARCTTVLAVGSCKPPPHAQCAISSRPFPFRAKICQSVAVQGPDLQVLDQDERLT